MHIKRLNSVRKLAVFDAYAPTAGEGHFYRYNLVYGFNGCGKTTLSRIFASLEQGMLVRDFPEGGEFEILLADAATIGHGHNIDRLKGRVAVFNEDFVETNFRWREGSANSVFYLGTEQAGLAEALYQTQTDREIALKDRDKSASEQTAATNGFATFKRDTARNIAEQFGLGRGYVATQLDRDFARGIQLASLADEEQAALRAVLAHARQFRKAHLDLRSSARLTEMLGKQIGKMQFEAVSVATQAREVAVEPVGGAVVGYADEQRAADAVGETGQRLERHVLELPILLL